MPVFTRHAAAGCDRIAFEATDLVMAGWTGRARSAVQHHVDELAALGVPPPSRTPLFYRMDPALLAGPVAAIEVLGEQTSGEVEAVLVALADGLWVGLGSDHTDRAMEAHGVAISKQLCRKPMAAALWRFAEVADHWDELVLRAHIHEAGERRLYMEAGLASVQRPADLIAAYAAERGFPGAAGLPPGTVLFMGAIAAEGGIRPAARFEMELSDPVLGRTLHHAYEVRPLPIVCRLLVAGTLSDGAGAAGLQQLAFPTAPLGSRWISKRYDTCYLTTYTGLSAGERLKRRSEWLILQRRPQLTVPGGLAGRYPFRTSTVRSAFGSAGEGSCSG